MILGSMQSDMTIDGNESFIQGTRKRVMLMNKLS